MDEPPAKEISRENLLALSFVNQETGLIEGSKLSRAKRVKLAEMARRTRAAQHKVKKGQLDRGEPVTTFWDLRRIREAEAEGRLVLSAHTERRRWWRRQK